MKLLKSLFGKVQYEECDCHPLPSFGPFKWYKLDYLREIHLPTMGIAMVALARPHRGTVTFGLFVKAFGKLHMFLPIYGKKKR